MTTWTRPCACGVDVTANPNDPTPGVREHNATPEHRTWRRRREKVVTAAIARHRLRAEVEAVRYSRGVWLGRVESTQQVPDNGGVSQPNIEDLDVSLPDPRVAAA